MTLIFSGNSFKYQLEAVCKLFLPVETFDFMFLDGKNDAMMDRPEGDYCFICRIEGVKNSMLSVYVKMGARAAMDKCKIPIDTPNYDADCEFELSKLLFNCLVKLTGKRPEWGVLTGVRPVKLINKLRSSGMNYDEILNKLTCDCCVTEEKVKVGYDTAVNQDRIVSAMPKKSFSLYVSIPFCPTRCSYCSFISQTVQSFKKLMPEYVDKLCEEIKFTAELVKGSGFTLDTVYFGGGTPTSIEAEQLCRIMQTVNQSFDLSDIREYTVEAGRPDTITPEKLAVIKENGGDRVSINPQTIHDGVLEAIGRKHTYAQFCDSYKLARSVGFKAVNVDLIAGLPTDTIEGFKQTMESIIALQPENITVHTLSIKRASDLMSKYTKEDGEAAKEMVAYASKRLYESGYQPYYLYRQKNQLDNQENIGWTKPGFAGIYNINIMEEVQSIVAVGAGATSKIINGCFERFFNPKYPLEYIKHFDTVLERKRAVAKLLNDYKDGEESK